MPNPTGIATKDTHFGKSTPRLPQPQGLAADGKVSAKSLRCISYGDSEVELTNVEQLVEISQAKAIADCLQKLGDHGEVDGTTSFRDVVERLSSKLMCGKDGKNGLDKLSRWGTPNGFYALPRKFEIAAALSRLRTLSVIGSISTEDDEEQVQMDDEEADDGGHAEEEGEDGQFPDDYYAE